MKTRFPLFPRLLPLIACLCLGAGCGFPHDPDRTSERVQGGTMRVGVVENPPWVRHASDGSQDATGIEADLVRDFARRQHARIEWVWGTENDHMQALKSHDLDLVIAGLTTETAWDGKVGLTRPYFSERVVVGVPPAQPRLRDLARQRVAVERGSALAHLLQKQGAIPLTVADMTEQAAPPPNLPTAAPEWRLKQWGLVPTDIELTQEQHVLAVPPGENHWLMEWEKYLHPNGLRTPPLVTRETQE